MIDVKELRRLAEDLADRERAGALTMFAEAALSDALDAKTVIQLLDALEAAEELANICEQTGCFGFATERYRAARGGK